MTIASRFARPTVFGALVAGAMILAGGAHSVPGARASDVPATAEGGGDLSFVTVQGDFAEVALDVEDAIVNRGLVIDYHGFVADMLARTAEAVGADQGRPIYANAEYWQFCSAALSRAMMEADPRNIGYCPYTIVAYELAASPGEIHVGYRRPGAAVPEASMKALSDVDTLLSGIVADATK